MHHYIYADYLESNANNFAASLYYGNCKLNFYVKNAIFQGENGFSAKNNSSINATIDEKLKIYVKHRGFLVEYSTLTLNAKDLEVVVMDPGKQSTGVIDNRKGAVTTITATNNINFRTNSDQKSALVIKNQGKLTLSANNVYIGSVVDNAISHTGSSLSISAKNSIRIDGDVFSTSKLNSSVVDINKDGKANVTIVGNVGTSNGTITTGNEPGNYPSNQLTLNLGKFGSLTGAVLDKKGTGENLDTKGTNLILGEGAAWNVTEDSSVTQVNSVGGLINVSALNTADGSAPDVVIESLTGDASVLLDAASDNRVTIQNGSQSNILIQTTETADDVTPEQLQSAIERVGGSSQVAGITAEVREGLYNGAIVSDGTTVTQKVNTIMKDSLALASASTLNLNRIVMNDVRKRLGDIRSSRFDSGAWARYDGGRLSGEGIKSKFNTIQVGIDTVPTPDAIRFGIAGSFTQSDTDYTRGDADMDAYGIAFYGVYQNDSGAYADVITRMAVGKSDFTIDQTKKGKHESVALSLSGEIGHRFDFASPLFIEPQLEATFTYVDSSDLTLENHEQTLGSYEYSAMKSFIGRAGLVAGIECPNRKDNLYIRASAVREFLGDQTIIGANGTSLTRRGRDTWFEFGLGMNFNLNDQTYIWADFERTSGAALNEDIRASVGLRFSF